mmetsp:Transcript_19574/g.40582  ORF Transcript_19574/g.40582 Transcript_19574/m.40582 type:complete len:226 (-) Transcript_19574:2093-2770(-)
MHDIVLSTVTAKAVNTFLPRQGPPHPPAQCRNTIPRLNGHDCTKRQLGMWNFLFALLFCLVVSRRTFAGTIFASCLFFVCVLNLFFFRRAFLSHCLFFALGITISLFLCRFIEVVPVFVSFATRLVPIRSTDNSTSLAEHWRPFAVSQRTNRATTWLLPRNFIIFQGTHPNFLIRNPAFIGLPSKNSTMWFRDTTRRRCFDLHVPPKFLELRWEFVSSFYSESHA